MKQYWPNAVIVFPDGEQRTQSTYDSGSMKQARETFRVWLDIYKFNLLRCWVDVYENGEKVGVDRSLYLEAHQFAVENYCNREGQCWKMDIPDCPFIDACKLDIEHLEESGVKEYFESVFVAQYLKIINKQ